MASKKIDKAIDEIDHQCADECDHHKQQQHHDDKEEKEDKDHHDDAKHDDAKHDDAKHDDAKHDDAKHDDAKHDDAKHDDAKHEDKVDSDEKVKDEHHAAHVQDRMSELQKLDSDELVKLVKSLGIKVDSDEDESLIQAILEHECDVAQKELKMKHQQSHRESSQWCHHC